MDFNTCKKIVQTVTAFLAWTVTSFLCHESAKVFLRTGTTLSLINNSMMWAFVITVIQMMLCYLAIDIHSSETHSPCAEKVKVTCHVLATLATNYSMTLVHASSTFAIKLLEPVTSALFQYLILGTSVSPMAFLTLPIIIGGALTFCENSLHTSTSTLGLAMAALSNVILAFRNIAIKLEQGADLTKCIQLRSRQRTFTIGAVLLAVVLLVEYLGMRGNVSSSVAVMTLTGAFSGVYHVSYSYISVNIVLLYMSVVSHSVANIFKRVLVVMLLYAMGHKEATLTNFLGLAVCSAGLLSYVAVHQREKVTTAVISSKMPHRVSLAKVRQIGLLIFCICGPLFSVFYIYNDIENGLSYLQQYKVASNSQAPKSPTSTLLPDIMKYKENTAYASFLNKRLLKTPTETDVLSPKLSSTFEVIAEAQRIHHNLFSDLFAKYKYAILLDIAVFENKGDPAITEGEVYLIRRLGIELVYYCKTTACTEGNLQYAKRLSTNYSADNLIILLHGGGNLVGYPYHDILRAKMFKLFSNFQMVLFPQSVYLRRNDQHLQYCQTLYQNQANLTMILRDRQSLGYARKYFTGKSKFMMLPDMAFQIGPVRRFISPFYDILWIKRTDVETPRYTLPELPPNVTVHSADWLNWPTPRGQTSMETAFLMANNGFVFVQRGRVVITDRLHGHILSTLLDIPHVLIDNREKKLSAYHNTWTRGLANTVMADNSTHALHLAVELLKKYNRVLPPIVPFVDVREVAPRK